MDGFLAAYDLVLREAALFAAIGFLFLGISDLAIDLIWIGRAGYLRLSRSGRREAAATPLERDEEPGAFAVFIPAWDEAGVIGRMLRHASVAYGGADVRLYVGCYPNDPDTIAVVSAIPDPRVRIVVGPAPGPTTKADCLNRIWEAMCEDEEAAGWRYDAVVLHDAEDVVHSGELEVFNRLIGDHPLVQLPVLPLIDRHSRWIAGHYADEFAEAHGKGLVVRTAIGAALPSSGVGCAVSRHTLDALVRRFGVPFHAESVTEDYELGLRLRELGSRGVFVRAAAEPGRPVIATREYFPGTLSAAVAQKARWMRGIALSGWERLGWGGGFAERWMRMRDRQSLLAALLLASGYLAMLMWLVRAGGSVAAGLPRLEIPRPLQILLIVNVVLLAWRLFMRFCFVAAAYGWREGVRSVPRSVVGNIIDMLAARQAVSKFVGRGSGAAWEKTRHVFPAEVPGE